MNAVSLLAETGDKIETITLAVVYENPFTFSNAFKRRTGRHPSDYRKKRHGWRSPPYMRRWISDMVSPLP